jgi:hypothetical protein
MDNTLCLSFFAQPTQTLHRRYEALRAVFLEQRPLTEVAQRFGYRYGTLRNLVAEFRAQSRTGQLPPFSPPRRMDDPDARGASASPLNPTPRRLPIVANWP